MVNLKCFFSVSQFFETGEQWKAFSHLYNFHHNRIRLQITLKVNEVK